MGSVMQGYDLPLHVQLDIFIEDPHIMFRLLSNNLLKKYNNTGINTAYSPIVQLGLQERILPGVLTIIVRPSCFDKVCTVFFTRRLINAQDPEGFCQGPDRISQGFSPEISYLFILMKKQRRNSHLRLHYHTDEKKCFPK